ncbi:MAG: hypothetical protein SFU86_22475 [Pirellulaceae bacterium]|nr:hypothetical protein [Pirellulaceae bacterium]
MPATYDELIQFLHGLGTENVPHTKGKFLDHLVAVDRDLAAWGCDEELCRAGMFHSIYGTERFRKFSLPLERRADVRELIGERAERLAYVNCVMDRATLDRALAGGPPYVLQSHAGEVLELSAADFDDLCRVHLCDWLEQVPRSQQWSYRRDAYQRMASRLGGVAQAAFDAVYAAEPAASPS